MPSSKIFTAGGAVQPAGIYISRPADDELLALTRAGSFAYVLTARQLGKSSLMIRTAERLAAEGVRTAIVDLSAFGIQVTAAQWYLGLLLELESQFDLDTDVLQWWEEFAHVGITQRFTMFFQEVLVRKVNAPIVIFIDEIDTTLSLDFTDDFFAAIRSLYNSRAVSPDLRRLSFVLIGVATPGDLMKDPTRTPFNVGIDVDLSDFTYDEALQLAVGLNVPEATSRQAIAWILKWTNGHPFLTQCACFALAKDDFTTLTEADIDERITATFLRRDWGENVNLQFCRDMLTRRAPDVEDALTTYGEILLGKHPVSDDPHSLTKSHLKLSGLVRSISGTLQIRNLIYRTFFDEAWINRHLKPWWSRPVVWLRRLKRRPPI